MGEGDNVDHMDNMWPIWTIYMDNVGRHLNTAEPIATQASDVTAETSIRTFVLASPAYRTTANETTAMERNMAANLTQRELGLPKQMP